MTTPITNPRLPGVIPTEGRSFTITDKGTWGDLAPTSYQYKTNFWERGTSKITVGKIVDSNVVNVPLNTERIYCEVFAWISKDNGYNSR